ncbi:MAG: PRC-barrel domain-containing protein [Candidatus Aceula meridiana]|nr:PRC-barrel domain-containing protein [Candidatus Aceula meridiana]
MLRSVNEILGYSIKAKDEEVGKVSNFYFDDERWTIRYLIADTGSWLLGKQILISPAGFYGKPDWKNKIFSVVFRDKEQVKECPDIYTNKPVSRQKELEYINYFGWPAYWDLEAQQRVAPMMVPPKAAGQDSEEKNTHLRSVKEVKGYHIHAKDGEIGHVEDFIIDDEKWDIRFIVVAIRNILPGKKVLIPTMWIQKVSWKDSEVYVGLIKENVEKSLTYDPSTPVNSESEGKLYDYYGRPNKQNN